MLKLLNVAPIALGNAAANLLNCNVTSLAGPIGLTVNQPFIVIEHIHFANIDTSTRWFSLYKGATAGSVGTTALFFQRPILPLDVYDYFPSDLRLDAADFLTGLSDVANKVILTFDLRIGISG